MSIRTFEGAPCVNRWDLFDSTYHGAHVQAKALCLHVCPHYASCDQHRREVLQGDRGGIAWLTGTWAGRLYQTKGRKLG